MTNEEYDNVPSSPTMVSLKHQDTLERDLKVDDLSPTDICNMFNEFLHQFEQMEKSGVATTGVFLDAVEEITNAVLKIRPNKILHPRVLHHPLILFLHQMLMDILDNWRALDARLNIQESEIFLKIVLLFLRAAEQAPESSAEEYRKQIREMLATRRLLGLIREQIDDNIVNKQGINDDPSICTLGLLTINLLRGCPFYFSAERNARLFDDLIMNCLDSYDYLHAVQQLQRGEQLTEIDRFLLFTCWDYVPFVSINLADPTNPIHATAIAQNTYHQLLTRFEELLKKPPPVAPPSIAYILHRCFQLLSIPHLASFDKHADQLIDHLIHLLSQPEQDPAIIITALESFDNFVNHDDLRPKIEQKKLTSLFNSFTAKDKPDEVRKLAFAIIAQIIDEEQVAQSTNIPEMMSVFIEQLKHLDPNGYNEDADTSLTSLRALMQHDEMKKEFVKQGGIDKLISFIRDGDPDKQAIEQLTDAMKILWSCTFNQPDVIKTLQQDTQLMMRVHQLLQRTKSKEELNADFEKAAEGLIWKVEGEEKFMEQRAAELEQKKQEKKRKAQDSGQAAEEEEEEEEEQYDLMISYSWADMDLVHRICHHLRDKLGYKIWLDQEQMHGSTIQAMANAVDGAQFILMCMSETYKRSANCQSEAEYAFNRKKHIVPLKLKTEYNPDGWLGFILGTRLYIDFGRYEFEKAIDLLHNEIQLQKKKRKDAKEAAKAERKVEAENKQREETLKQANSPKTAMMLEDVTTWNQTDVRDFLLKQNLTAMVPLCHGIAGNELMELYGMCRANPSSMYRSLKFELLHGYHRLLPIATYLRFVTLMRSVCGDGAQTKMVFPTKATDEVFADE